MRLSKTRILIVDDNAATLKLLEHALSKEGAVCLTANCGDSALGIAADQPVDLVLTDIHMPGMDGLQFMEKLKKRVSVDVVVMTADIGRFRYDKIIEMGAVDFLVKPLNMREVALRLQRAIRERRLIGELEAAHETIKQSYLDTIRRLVVAAEHNDECTGDHIARMSEYCALLAQLMKLPKNFVENLRHAAPMHDIGKIGISNRILSKPGSLSDKEFERVKTHTLIGAHILEDSASEVISLGREIALSHHEKWDGTGYPNGLKGEEIPLSGRIVCVADVFDTLISPRPYKSVYPPSLAYSFIEERLGTHFDPFIGRTFLDHFDKFLKLSSFVVEELPQTAELKSILSERDISKMR